MKHFSYAKYYKMATVQSFEAKFGKFNVVGICTAGNHAQERITKL